MEKPEARQSEQSDVCRDRAKGKYLLPEGRACRREAVVRRVPEAGRKSFGMVPVPGAPKRSEVAPGNGTPWEDKSRRAEAVTAKRVSADGLTWFFVAMVITKRKRPETTRHLFAG